MRKPGELVVDDNMSWILSRCRVSEQLVTLRSLLLTFFSIENGCHQEACGIGNGGKRVGGQSHSG